MWLTSTQITALGVDYPLSTTWNNLSDADKAKVVNVVSIRWDALPWITPPTIQTDNTRLLDATLLGAFGQYCNFIALRNNSTNIIPDNPDDEDSLLSDIPLFVRNILLSRYLHISLEDPVEARRRRSGPFALSFSGDQQAVTVSNGTPTGGTTGVGISAEQTAQIETNKAGTATNKGGIATNKAAIETNKAAIETETTARTTSNAAIRTQIANIMSPTAPADGLTQAQVDARVLALVDGYAETGSAETIPAARLAVGSIALSLLTPALQTRIAANDAKRSYPEADETKLALITGTNTGDQEISGIGTNAAAIDAAVSTLNANGDAIATNITAIAALLSSTNANTAQILVIDNKLVNVEDGAKDDQTGAEIRDLLAALTGTGRLPATAIKDLPTGGDSTTATHHPVIVSRKMPIAAQATLLAAASAKGNAAVWIVAAEQNATDNQTGSTIRALSPGILDADGNAISMSNVPANTVQLRAGTIVRITTGTDFRVVSAPPTVLSTEEVNALIAAAIAGLSASATALETKEIAARSTIIGSTDSPAVSLGRPGFEGSDVDFGVFRSRGHTIIEGREDGSIVPDNVAFLSLRSSGGVTRFELIGVLLDPTGGFTYGDDVYNVTLVTGQSAHVQNLITNLYTVTGAVNLTTSKKMKLKLVDGTFLRFGTTTGVNLGDTIRASALNLPKQTVTLFQGPSGAGSYDAGTVIGAPNPTAHGDFIRFTTDEKSANVAALISDTNENKLYFSHVIRTVAANGTATVITHTQERIITTGDRFASPELTFTGSRFIFRSVPNEEFTVIVPHGLGVIPTNVRVFVRNILDVVSARTLLSPGTDDASTNDYFCRIQVDETNIYVAGGYSGIKLDSGDFINVRDTGDLAKWRWYFFAEL